MAELKLLARFVKQLLLSMDSRVFSDKHVAYIDHTGKIVFSYFRR